MLRLDGLLMLNPRKNFKNFIWKLELIGSVQTARADNRFIFNDMSTELYYMWQECGLKKKAGSLSGKCAQFRILKSIIAGYPQTID